MFYLMNSGIQFDPTDMRLENITIADISHHLARVYRFGGSLSGRTHYSVATHSLNLMNWVMDELSDPDLARCVLMHDAAEAYLGDIVSPLKHCLPDYKRLEQELNDLIWQKFNLSTKLTESTSHLDRCILLDEVKSLIPHQYDLYETQLNEGRCKYRPLGVKIISDDAFGPNRIADWFKSACYTLDIGE